MKTDGVMKIGSVVLESPFVLAPLAGITDAPFRRLCREQGASFVYSEMVSCKGLLYNDRSTERLLRFYEEEKPVAYQVFGSEPEIVGLAARKLSTAMNDVLDINMGCPVPKIVKNGEGSALLKNLGLMHEIISAAVSEAKKPVTVKIRSGWDGSSINAVEAAQTAESAGAAAVAVHGRTRDQFYSGKADWQVIKDVKKSVGIPVIGNGDIFTAEGALRMLSETGCDFAMIARGALGNPWIFREAVSLWRTGDKAAAPTPAEKKEMVRRHFADLVAEKGEHVAVREMRKHIGWYLKGMPHSAEVRRQANTIKEADDFFRLLQEFKWCGGNQYEC